MDLIAHALIEAFFYGLCYFTGSFLVIAFTLGKIHPAECVQDKEARKENRKQYPNILYTLDGVHYLRSDAVSVAGGLFWAGVALFLYIRYAT